MSETKLKAWQAYNYNVEYSTVVFADTRGKARALAMNTDAFEDTPFTEIRICRLPQLDNEYRGHWEMDWYDDKDRLALVKKCSWQCVEPEFDDCETCVAKEYCEYYADYTKNNMAERG